MEVVTVTGARKTYRQGGRSAMTLGLFDDLAAAGDQFISTTLSTLESTAQDTLQASLPANYQQVVAVEPVQATLAPTLDLAAVTEPVPMAVAPVNAGLVLSPILLALGYFIFFGDL